MNNKVVLVSSLIISVGLMIGLISVGRGIESIQSSQRVVNVKGLSEKEVKADYVIYPVVYKEVGNDLSALYKTVKSKNDIIKSYITSAGITEDEISISSPNIVDLQADRWANENKKQRYHVTSVITIASKKVSKVKDLKTNIGELIDQGIAISSETDYDQRIQYSFTKLNEIKPAMIEEATKNARMSAEKFAKDSDSKLGKIKNASQGQFSIEDRDGNTPDIKMVRVVSSVAYYLED